MTRYDDLVRELQATREQLRNLIERNGEAIVVVDDRGRVQFANPAAERLFRRTQADLVDSDLGLPLVVGETTEVDIVNGDTPVSGVAEMRVVETEWGGEHALLAVLRDVTDRKRAEHEREQLFKEQVARQEAEQALRERDSFMALASHELKTPAATLSATAQLLCRQLDRQGTLSSDQLRRGLERLEEQSKRLAQLVDRLLDVSSINSGKLMIDPKPVDVARLVGDVVAATQLTTDRHQILLEAPGTMMATVDPIRFEQVLRNLLDNAVKYSPDGGGINVELFQPEPEWLCVSVRDYGIGVPAGQRSELFERFFRASPDRHVAGMGLGLFITRHIVELHGGTIAVDSPDGGGSRFVVRLPLIAA